MYIINVAVYAVISWHSLRAHYYNSRSPHQKEIVFTGLAGSYISLHDGNCASCNIFSYKNGYIPLVAPFENEGRVATGGTFHELLGYVPTPIAALLGEVEIALGALFVAVAHEPLELPLDGVLPCTIAGAGTLNAGPAYISWSRRTSHREIQPSVSCRRT